MFKYILIILILLMSCFAYRLGYQEGFDKQERELKEFWGRYYSVKSQGDYWELKAKKEGLK